MEIYFLIAGIIFLIIEISVFSVISSVNKKFQWLILERDEKPKITNEILKKFLPHGYDKELGWVRKPNTEHEEMGKDGEVKWTINDRGARTNPGFESTESSISCYGDSFSFCRQVNNEDTWEHYLSELLKTNVQNFGVGNYGLDQAVLRLKREFESNQTEKVMIGVVPDTISRILSVWKHYSEYGNTLGFKPRFSLNNDELKILHNPIDSEEKFLEYEKYLEYIQSNDYFYEKKFKKEKISFPYSLTNLRNWRRNFEIIKWVRKISKMEKSGIDSKNVSWKPMSIIMKKNLEWRIELFKDKNNLRLIKKILEKYVEFSKEKKFIPIFFFLPQKDDILFIEKNYNFYENMIKEIMEIDELVFLDITKNLLHKENLDELYSDENEYGGHYSKEGNKKIAELIFYELEKQKII